MAVDCVEFQPVDHLNRLNHMFHISTHEFNVSSSYKQPVSQARTGHARFRRSPSSVSSSPESNGPSTSSQSVNETTSSSSSRSTNSFSSMTSSLAGGGLDGSVSNGKQFSSSLGIVAPSLTFSSKKPPLPSTHRKRCIAERPVANVHGSGYHCCKRRKIGSKREVRRVPITGSKVTSIPADDYSWKKYGEKRIEGSPYPRVYYKCSTGKGCPARKLVELAKDDSKMLLVTYDGEHRHRVHPTPVPTGLTGLIVQSK